MNERVRKAPGQSAPKAKRAVAHGAVKSVGSAAAEAKPAAAGARGGRARAGGRAAATAPESNAEGLEVVISERDALRQALAQAQTRIADLERRQAEALDRIDWAIDTLSSLLGSVDLGRGQR